MYKLPMRTKILMINENEGGKNSEKRMMENKNSRTNMLLKVEYRHKFIIHIFFNNKKISAAVFFSDIIYSVKF